MKHFRYSKCLIAAYCGGKSMIEKYLAQAVAAQNARMCLFMTSGVVAAAQTWHRPFWSGSPARSCSDAFSPPPNSEAAANDREQPASGVPVIELIE
jgi:hypothetical protein